MPFTEDERDFGRDHYRQRGQRSPLAQRSGKMTGVVLALDGPAEGEAATGEARERTLEVAVHSSAPGIEHCDRGRDTRGNEPLALGLAPGFERGGIHGGNCLVYDF